MADLDSVEFDIFQYFAEPQALIELQCRMFESLGVISEMGISKSLLEGFIRRVKNRYAPIPFHNYFHAADVSQMVYLFLTKGELQKYLSTEEKLVLILGGVTHDMGHSGVSNSFLVSTHSKLIDEVGETSVLETYSYCVLERTLKQEDSNFLVHLPEEQQKRILAKVKDIVLATDMERHFELMTAFADLLDRCPDFSELDEEGRTLVMEMTLKTCDLANTYRTWQVTERWAGYMMEEFFNQGDLEREKSLEVTPFMDRSVASKPQVQMTFVENIALPLLKTFSQVLVNGDHWVSNLESNLRSWKELWEREQASQKG